jgi:hypothetical protein
MIKSPEIPFSRKIKNNNIPATLDNLFRINIPTATNERTTEKNSACMNTKFMGVRTARVVIEKIGITNSGLNERAK